MLAVKHKVEMVAVAVLLVMSAPCPPNILAQTPPTKPIEAIVSNIITADDRSSLIVMPIGQTAEVSFDVRKELQTALKDHHKGDVVHLRYGEENGKKTLTNISPKTVEVPGLLRIAIFAVVSVILWYLVAWVIKGSPGKLAIGLDDRYSSSQFQMAVWFALLLVAYVATILLRGVCGGLEFVGGVGIPQNLLMLSGLSAFTFAAARGITTTKAEQAAKAAQAVPQLPPQGGGGQQPVQPAGAQQPAPQAGAQPQAQPAVAQQPAQPAGAQHPPRRLKEKSKTGPKFPDDLVQNDEGKVDLGDFQMLIITFLAGVVYIFEVFKFLGSIELLRVVSLPDVDTTILSLFGLGQGAYLVKKVGGNVGQS